MFTAIVDTLVYLLAPFLPLIPTLLYRKRLVAWFARQIGPYVVQGVAEWAFVTEDVEAADGTKTQRRALSAPARALLASVLPALIQEGLKSIKFTPGKGSLLPPGVTLENVDPLALIGMLPGKYGKMAAGAIGVAKALGVDIGGILGGLTGGKVGTQTKPEGKTASVAVEEMIRR